MKNCIWLALIATLLLVFVSGCPAPEEDTSTDNAVTPPTHETTETAAENPCADNPCADNPCMGDDTGTDDGAGMGDDENPCGDDMDEEGDADAEDDAEGEGEGDGEGEPENPCGENPCNPCEG